MATTEGTTLQQKIVNYINSISGCKARKISSDAIQGAGLPDIIAVCNGVPVWIEVKVGNDVLSKIQEKELNDWRKAGAVIIIAKNMPEFIQKFNQKFITFII